MDINPYLRSYGSTDSSNQSSSSIEPNTHTSGLSDEFFRSLQTFDSTHQFICLDSSFTPLHHKRKISNNPVENIPNDSYFHAVEGITTDETTSRLNRTNSDHSTGNRQSPRFNCKNLLDYGLIPLDNDCAYLYRPYTVKLAPLIPFPKVKKHSLVRLLEPDIGITSTSSYTQFPNMALYPSTAVPSDSIYSISSIMSSLNELENREKLILLSLRQK